MNILFVTCTFRLFDGIDCGAANRSTMFVKALSKIGYVDVVSFCDEPIKSNVPNCEVVVNVPVQPKYQNSKTLKDRAINCLSLLVSPGNPQVYYSLDKQCEAIVDNQFKVKKYDIVACRYIGEAIRCGLQKYEDCLVVDVDDNLVSASLRDFKNQKFKNILSRFLFFYKAHTIGYMSKKFLKNVRVSFYSNILEPTSKKSIFLHNVTHLESQNLSVTENTPQRLLIVGWLDFHPNKNGVKHFVEHVFPSIIKRIPAVELHIVGKTKDLALKEDLNSRDGVTALGFVDDIMAEYANCRIIVVPIYQGAGTSVKFIEGLMMKRPIVSTPMGARGFETMCHPGSEYLLAKDDEEFAENIIKLLQSPNLAEKIASNAYLIGNEYFSSEKFENIVVTSIRKEFQL